MRHLSADNTAHWRERAEEARRLADIYTGVVERDNMLSCANMYDRLADMAETRENMAQKPANDPF